MDAKTLGIKYEPNGVTATLEVEGVDMTSLVRRITIDHVAREAPLVFLELKKGVELDPVIAEAVVHIREVVQEDPADATLRFLEPLDPGEFEKAILAAMELGGPQTFGEAALLVLRGYAGGNDNGS